MSNWRVGDLAVAKRCAGFSQCVCGAKSDIHKGSYYRVIDIDLFPRRDTGELIQHLNVGSPEGCGGEYFYPHVFFEKIVPATTDIFKLADQPVPRELVTENWT